MRAVRSTLSPRHQRRRCLACGFDGPALQGHRAEQVASCPACGEDLYARPPRSYAELEAIEDEVEIITGPEPEPPPLLQRLMARLRRILRWRR